MRIKPTIYRQLKNLFAFYCFLTKKTLKMAEGLRNRNIGPKLGLHLCERCEKDKAESLKKLLNCCKVEETISELTTEIKEIKKMLKEKTEKKGWMIKCQNGSQNWKE